MVFHTLEIEGPKGKRLQSVLEFCITQSNTSAVLNTGIPTTGLLTAHLIEQARNRVVQMDPVPFKRLLEKTRVFVQIATGISEVGIIRALFKHNLNYYPAAPICKGCFQCSLFCM